MTMDVSLRLRLENDLSKEAKVAERDLKGLGDEAKKLGRAGGADKLGKEIGDVRREADRSKKSVGDLDRQARKLGSVNTDHAEKEIRAIGTASKIAAKEVDTLHRKLNTTGRGNVGKSLSEIERPASSLKGTMALLGTSATSAFAGLAAFASVDNIIRGLEGMSRQFKQLDRDVASVAVTAEMRTPEAIEKISKSNEALSIRYGVDQGAVNNARKTYAAAGFGIDQQEAILDPTLKSAKASTDSSTPVSGETISKAVIALQQNLGVTNEDVPTVLDMMSKGAKLGNFEVGNMASNFPKLATMYAGTGRTGPQAAAELVAAAQVVMKSAGSPDIAANNLDNLIGKLSAPDAVKNFSDAGVSLESIRKKSEKNGTPYLMDVVDQVMKMTGGDSFRIGELFGDKEAKLALLPLIENRKLFSDFLNQIVNESAGTTDADWDFLSQRPQEKSDRRAAAIQATGNKFGEAYDRRVAPLADRAVRLINPDYDRQRTIEEEPERLRETAEERLRIENEILRLQGQRREMADGGQALGPQINRLKEQLQTLLEEEAAIIENTRQASEVGRPATTKDSDLGKTTGNIAIPQNRPSGNDLGRSTGVIPIPQSRPAEFSAVATDSMDAYNAALAEGGQQAEATGQGIVDRLKAMFGFTVSPTIAPTLAPPSGGAAPATGEKQSSLNQASSVKVAQNFYGGGNARMAANRAQREQNRAVRQAMARSLSDTGSKLA